MNKLRGQLKAFMKNEEKQAIASRIMVQKQYTFEDVIEFMKKVQFDMKLFLDGASQQQDEVDGKQQVKKGAKNYQEDYSSIYLLYKAVRQAGLSAGRGPQSSMLTKQQVQEMFDIQKREVRFEEAAGESLKKPKAKPEATELSKTTPSASAA